MADLTQAGTGPLAATELDAIVAQGLRLQRSGRLTEAREAYRAVLAIDPRHAEANHLLGLTLHAAGQPDEAARFIGVAIEAAPGNAIYRTNLGVMLRDAGRLDEAVASYQAALAIDPSLAAAHSNLGVALLGLGQAEEAAKAQREALRLNPDYAEAQANLGLALAESGAVDAALAAYRAALALRPDYLNALIYLTAALRAAGRLAEAEDAAGAAIALKPGNPGGHHALAEVLVAGGRLEAAIDSFRAALGLRPDAIAYRNLGSALNELGGFRDAAAAFRAALELREDDAASHAGLGRALAELGGMPRALESYRRAVALDPGNGRYRTQMAAALIAVGLIDEAEAAYAALLEQEPEALTPRRALVFTSNYLDVPAAEISRRAREYGQRLASQLPARTAHANVADPERRLRVGLVSGDLNQHPVAVFLENVLKAIDPQQIELFAYANSLKVDAMTEMLRSSVPNWRSVAKLGDDALDAMIIGDTIDILVDLSGYSGESRLSTFARKPAPVAVTWLGYSGTTGLSAIDYVLADRWVVPRGEEELYTEQVWRLPDSYLCYSPRPDVEEVAALPALTNGHVTFGSFNNLNKVNDATLQLWGEVLAAIPTARLALKSTVLRRQDAPDELRRRCAAAGIPADRLVLLPYAAEARDHLAAYRDIDIGLDPFPYNGTTTTCEAMLMGVPVLTLKGDRFIAHVGESLLRTVGLDDWIAGDAAAFVVRAAAIAADLAALAELRNTLRPRLLASPLCDARRFARNLEAAFRSMWERWCEAQAAPER